jgi:ribosomal protein L34
VLPNIEPGYAGRSTLGVHMFTRHAVWKDVIHTPSQLLMEIPDELGQYLGDYEKKPRWNPRSISLLAPSRWRPEQCIRNIRDNWLLRAKDLKDIELIIAVDTDDETVSRYLVLADQAFQNMVSYKVITGQHQSMTQALETAAKASTGDILISVFDDFEAPDEWDVYVKDRLRDQEGKCLFVYDDMHDVSVTLQTMTIMTRRCYRDWGYCWYKEYLGMYGDQDYTEHCLLENRAVWALDLIFVHHHYIKIGAARDRTYAHGNAREKTENGKRVLAERRACRFRS